MKDFLFGIQHTEVFLLFFFYFKKTKHSKAYYNIISFVFCSSYTAKIDDKTIKINKEKED